MKRLCLLLQRYTFWSNSQLVMVLFLVLMIVLATAKIHILKQFTTGSTNLLLVRRLCLLLQRYTFWSNSQLHLDMLRSMLIVLATAKIHILKQFTTRRCYAISWEVLCLLLQRYTFWSNSQLSANRLPSRLYCACYCKDTHFEAIHNCSFASVIIAPIVLATAKIHILKQFTTLSAEIERNLILCLLLQRYTFWSNSQRNGSGRPSRPIVLATAKIHILKQFTTEHVRYTCIFQLCLLLQRYTFWSNSQQGTYATNYDGDCACYCKDTHFEAIHNVRVVHQLGDILCLLLQRYTFWSNSQLLGEAKFLWSYCACYCKDTHFEAIHNGNRIGSIVPLIVLATAKIHILKQFTTKDGVLKSYIILCLLLQRYTFWSNSQRQSYWFYFASYCACYCKDTHFEAIHNNGK